jgi:hypothetical protein
MNGLIELLVVVVDPQQTTTSTPGARYNHQIVSNGNDGIAPTSIWLFGGQLASDVAMNGIGGLSVLPHVIFLAHCRH